MNTELAALENSVTLLLDRYHRLQDDNTVLRRELESLRGENKRLTERMASTAERLENLLERLPEE